MRLFGPWIEEKRSILIVGPDFKRLQCRINYPERYYALNAETSEELEVWVVRNTSLYPKFCPGRR
jgi:hypothetical protein